MLSFFKKIYIPEAFKTKKFIVFVFLAALFFLFAPISLHQIGKRAESFINSRAVAGVKKFEQQTGLQIEWKSLEFNIFMMTVALEGVIVNHLQESSSAKIEELRFLNGLQKIKKITARPSLYSFLFKKEVLLSKLNIESGDIFLKTLKNFKKSANGSKTIELPIKKIFIKDTNINLRHKEYSLRFSDIKSEIYQKSGSVFDFNLIVQSFYFDKHLGFEDFFNVQSSQEDEEKIYQLFLKGVVEKNRASFSQISLKNNFFSSFTKTLELDFGEKGLTYLKASSSGSLPLSLVQEGFSFMNKDFQFADSNVSYDLDLQYDKNKGYRGAFTVLSEDLIFRSEKLKKIELSGHLHNQFLFINKGFIKTENKGDIYIKSIEWGGLEKTLPFSFSMELDQLSSDFIAYTFLDLPQASVSADLTGLFSCQGRGDSFDVLNCQFKGGSQKLQIQNNNQVGVLSFHDLNLDVALDWNNDLLLFEVKGDKKELTQVNIAGQYSKISDVFSAEYSFIGRLGSDLRFNTPFSLEGDIRAANGKIDIRDNQIRAFGDISSFNLNIDDYDLKNISSSYKLQGSQLQFKSIRGYSGKSIYSAEAIIDFDKENLKLQLDSSFFDISDFIKTVRNKITFPVDFKGSGSLSFDIYKSWKAPNEDKFQLTGDFFNVFIGMDFFSQSTFDIIFENQKGRVQSFLLRKGQGLIEGSGFFDEKYNFNLTMSGRKLPLENIELLNSVLSFNQSGDVSFNLDIKGGLNNPDITGSVIVSNAFFYSYPVKDSVLDLKINKDSFSFLGNIMDEIKIEEFIYYFSNQSNMKIKGHFHNLDFIKILLSKNKREQIQNYSSQLGGSFDIKKIDNSFWKGKLALDNILVVKSNQWIRNKNPFSIFLDKNRWFLDSSVEFLDHNNKMIRLEKLKSDQLLLKGSSSLGFFSVAVPFFEEFEGDIKGQVLLNNNFRRLKPKGSFQLERGFLLIQPLPSFVNVSAQLVFSKDNIIINDFYSGAGGGSVKGIGTVFYDFIQPPVLDLNLNFNKVYLEIPEGFNTKGNGKATIKGASPPYLIRGEYNIDSGSIVREFSSPAGDKRYDFSLLEKKEEKKKHNFELNLKLKTKRAVSVNSRLIRSSIEGFSNIYGPFNSLRMKGKFVLSKSLEENLIFFRGQEFKISSGEILFNNISPANPYLNITADTVFKEQVINPLEGQETVEKQYKIFLDVKGYSQNLNFSLKSNPVLNEREIISLLTLGVSSRRFDANVQQNITDYSYYPYQILTSLLLEKSLNKEIKDTLGFDFRLTPYIDTLNKPVTKITLSKNWFKKWRTSFSRTIEESAYSDARLKYDISDKLSLTAFWENNNKEQFVQGIKDDSLSGLDFEFSFDF